MYLMYVDESGDSGLENSPTRYFAMSGLVIHELRWNAYLEQLITFRQRIKQQFGLRLREEIHAAVMISRPGDLVRIKRNDRVAILKTYINELASMRDITVINIIVDKQGKPAGYDAFTMAWKALIQRFENTLSKHNFNGPHNPDERGMIFSDHTDDKKVMSIIRQMRKYNPVPHASPMGAGYRNITLSNVIEDPSYRDSRHSYFIQSVDVLAYFLYQHQCPNIYIKKKSAQNSFLHLEPILCKVASNSDPYGIVRL